MFNLRTKEIWKIELVLLSEETFADESSTIHVHVLKGVFTLTGNAEHNRKPECWSRLAGT